MSTPTPTATPTPLADPAATPPADPTPAATDPATPPVDPDPSLGDAGKKAIQAERARAAKAEADLKTLRQEIEDSKKTAEQKSADAVAAATATANEASAKALSYEVAAAKGLDLALAARLRGSTREELEADADTLMALIPKGTDPAAPPAPPVGPTVPGQQPGSPPANALVTQSDLDALGAANKYDEINRLRREGRLSHLGVAPPKAST